MKLEYVESLILAHPFIKGFDQTYYCISDEEAYNAAQDEISESLSKRTKDEIGGKAGATTIYTTSFFIGLAIEKKSRDGMSG